MLSLWGGRQVPHRRFSVADSGLCLSKTSKCLSGGELYFFHNSLLRCSSEDTPCHAGLDLSFARCPAAGEPGSAPPNRHPSALQEKTPEADPRGPLVVDCSVPYLA